MKNRLVRQIVLILGDALSVLVAFSLASLFRFNTVSIGTLGLEPALYFFLFTFFSFYILGLFEPYSWFGKIHSGPRIAAGIALSALTMSILVYALRIEASGLYGRGALGISTVLTFFLMASYRSALNSFWQKKSSLSSISILAPQKEIQYLVDDLKHIPSLQFTFLPEEDLLNSTVGDRFKSSSPLVAISENLDSKLVRQVLALKMSGEIECISLNRLYETYFQRIPIQLIDDRWLLNQSGFDGSIVTGHMKLKRVFDLVLSTGILMISSPLLILAIFSVWIADTKTPVLFSQNRVGKGGAVFKIFKLRTMRPNAEKPGEAKWAQEKDPRVTTIGRFLRKTRIDELPQLWNVAKGEMSLIGPRPERPEFTQDLEREIPFYSLRHSVTPGLTGWAQIHYPYGSTVEDAIQKLQFDLYYIKNHSLLLDLKIALRTAQVILFAKGR